MKNPLKNLKLSNLFMSVSKIDYVKVLYAIGVLLLILMLIKGCKDSNKYVDQLKDLSSKYDSTMALQKASDKRVDSLKTMDSLNILHIAYLNTVIDSQEVQLKQKSQSSKGLAGSILAHGKKPVDSSYKKSCDSLANLVLFMTMDIEDYRKNVKELIRNYDTAITNRDMVITEKDKQIADLKKLADTYYAKVNQAIPKIERHNELYLGGDIIGNKSDILHGFGVSGALVNTKGGMYNVGAYKINNDMFYSVGMKFRLSLRKK